MGHAFRFRLRSVGVFVALGVALALAGCGRKGPLELPASPPPTDAAGAATAARQARVFQNGDTPGLIQSPNQVVEESAAAKQQVFVASPAPPPINAPPVARPNRFILDPLL